MKKRQYLSFEEVRTSLQILYLREGTWSKVAKAIGMKKGTVHGIAVNGLEPKTEAIREQLGLEPLCPHCNRLPRKRRKPTRIRDMSKKQLLWALEHRQEM